jgi:hypothetical protein
MDGEARDPGPGFEACSGTNPSKTTGKAAPSKSPRLAGGAILPSSPGWASSVRDEASQGASSLFGGGQTETRARMWGMGLVPLHRDVLVAEREEVGHRGVETQPGKRPRFPGALEAVCSRRFL